MTYPKDKTGRVRIRAGSIRDALDGHGVSLAEMADDIGFGTSTIRKWNSGAAAPTANQVRVMAGYLGHPYGAFFEDASVVGGEPAEGGAEPRRTYRTDDEMRLYMLTGDDGRATAAQRQEAAHVAHVTHSEKGCGNVTVTIEVRMEGGESDGRGR